MSELNINNRTIFNRDNLSVLRGINSATIDLIYLDPPFNKDKRFVAPLKSSAKGASFRDIFMRERIKQDWILDIEEEHPKLHKLLEAVKGMEGFKDKNRAQADKDPRSYDYCYLVYMAIRLIECKRILKSDGSIYLHCDQTMSHYLKLAMDCIFGQSKFRNEIIWKRSSAHSDSRSFGKIADSILFYGAPINTDEAVREQLDPDYVRRAYRLKDQRGAYTTASLNTKGLLGRGYEYEFAGKKGPWRYPKVRMHELKDANLIHFPQKKDGEPRRKVYLHENEGQIPSNIWTDIPPVQSQSRERTGYRTQKPLALLKRIINASSEAGEIVLDPFCGCATAPVAAEDLSRFWIGVDVSIKAYDLVKERLARRQKDLFSQGDQEVAKKYAEAIEDIQSNFSTDAPIRTDGGADPQNQKFVYVMSHPSFPGEYKVGVSINAERRVKSYNTGAPIREYKLEYARQVPNANELEEDIHEAFGADPIEEGKERLGEWVRADLKDIIQAIEAYK